MIEISPVQLTNEEQEVDSASNTIPTTTITITSQQKSSLQLNESSKNNNNNNNNNNNSAKQKKQFQDYNPYQTPPNIKQAKEHGLAQRVSYPQDSDLIFKNGGKICSCCGLPITNQPLSIACEVDELAHLGTCYPLYFMFIKQGMILLLIQLFLSAIPSLVMNFLRGDVCNQIQNNSIICRFSFVNINDHHHNYTQYLESICNLLTILVQLRVVAFFRKQQNQKQENLDVKHLNTASRYSVIISNVPLNCTISDLQNFLESRVSGQKNDIVKLYMLQDIKEYAALHNQKTLALKKKTFAEKKINMIYSDYKMCDKDKQLKVNKYLEKLQRYEQLSKDSDEKRKSIETSILQKVKYDYQKKSNEEIEDLEVKNKEDETQHIQFSGNVIVTYNTIDTTKRVLSTFNLTFADKVKISLQRLSFGYFKFSAIERFQFNESNRISVIQAPPASDILWSNIGSTEEKTKLKHQSSIVSYACMIIAMVLIIKLKRMIKDKQLQEDQAEYQLLYSFLSSTLVAGANTAIGIVIRQFASKEQKNTKTEYFLTVANKLSKMFATNMICTTFFANYFSEKLFWVKEHEDKTILNPFPLNLPSAINDFFFLIITSSYISSLFSIVDVVWFKRLIKRWQIKRSPQGYTQEEANSTFEGHPVDLALRYANVVKILQYTAFISPILPIGVPMCMVGLTIIYWVDKWLLLRRWVCKNFISHKLAKSMMNRMHLCIVYFALGNLITMFLPVKVLEDWNLPEFYKSVFFYLALIGFVVSLLVHNIPFSKNMKKFFYKYDLIEYLLSKCYTTNTSALEKSISTSTLHLNQKLNFSDLSPSSIDDYDFYHPGLKQSELLKRMTISQQSTNFCSNVSISQDEGNADLKIDILPQESLSLDFSDNKVIQ